MHRKQNCLLSNPSHSLRNILAQRLPPIRLHPLTSEAIPYARANERVGIPPPRRAGGLFVSALINGRQFPNNTIMNNALIWRKYKERVEPRDPYKSFLNYYLVVALDMKF